MWDSFVFVSGVIFLYKDPGLRTTNIGTHWSTVLPAHHRYTNTRVILKLSQHTQTLSLFGFKPHYLFQLLMKNSSSSFIPTSVYFMMFNIIQFIPPQFSSSADSPIFVASSFKLYPIFN